jgi:seryl-tRNA(Sec) selenium transferase
MPNYEIDSCGITINIKSGAPVKISAQKLSDRLRRGSPPVVSTIEKDTLAIDFRTLLEIDEERLFSVLRTLDNELKP